MPPEDQVPATPAPVVPANSDTGNAPGSEATPAPEKSGEKLFTQADLDREIDKRLQRERAHAQTKADKAKADAEEADKVKQGEWQKLAEERKTQIEQLAPKSELADRLQEIVAKQLETEIATWPESVRAIMPKPESSLLDRLEWAERTRPLAQELIAAKGSNGTPYPAQHSGTGGNKPTTTKDQAQATLNKAYAPRKPAT